MSLPITVPYTFANATTAIPLSQLDTDLATVYSAVNGIANGVNALANVNIIGGTLDNVIVGSATPGNGSVTNLVATTSNLGTITAGTWNGTTINVAHGGTGLTSTPANGALDIGNGTGFTRTTLTAGSNITITNGVGSITIASTGGGGGGSGTVTSVDVSGGTTGLTYSGGPVTTSGTISMAGTLVVANGGTGSTTLTANSVMLGNGTGAVKVVAPGTSGNVLTSNGTTWISSAAGTIPTPSAIGQIPFSTDGSTYSATQKIVQGTAVASTSGTSIDFTSIPSWVKRVTVMFNGVSTSGASLVQIQVGSGSVSSSGYLSYCVYAGGASQANGVTATTGLLADATGAATVVRSGHITLTLQSSNTWINSTCIGFFSGSAYYSHTGGGASPALSGALDRIRITTVNGTDTFDAGNINIMYE
jgi:hypothetical protein